MNGGAYRESLVAGRARLDAERAQVLVRESRVTPALVACLPKPLAERIARLRAIAGDESREASLEELVRRVDHAILLVEALDEALEIAPELQVALSTLPEACPPTPWRYSEWGPSFTEKLMPELLRTATGAIPRCDVPAEAGTNGPNLWVKMRVRGAPILWTAAFGGEERFDHVRHALATTIPATLPPLSLRTLGIVDRIGRALHLAHGLRIGDAEFDAAFLVRGVRPLAVVLLAPSVRRLLLAVRTAAFGEEPVTRDVAFDLENGAGTIRWTGLDPLYSTWRRRAAMIEPIVVERAIEALIELRAVVAHLSLVHA